MCARTRMVGRQIEQRLCTGQLVFPVFYFPREALTAHVLTLPLRVLGVLEVQFGKLRRLVLGEGRVALCHFAEEKRNRPPIGDNMMHTKTRRCVSGNSRPR